MGYDNFSAVLAQAESSGGGIASSIFLFAIIGGVFYMFIIRPQRKRMAEMRSLHSSLNPGDEVRTVGGMIGRIDTIDDDIITLDMGGGTILRFTRQAIATKLTDDVEAAE